MIDFNSLFKITYGMYIVSSGDRNTGNGYISNTVFQVTSTPAKFAASCNKDNYTSKLIEEFQHFSVSILHQKTDANTFGTFGFKSGKDIDKLSAKEVKYGISGTPIILNDSIAYLECKVVEKIDMGTHWLFIGELIDAQIINDTEDPMTYDYYHKVKKGNAPKNAPTYIDKKKLVKKQESTKLPIYECIVCGHIYDDNEDDIKFVDLPEDWACPTCGAEKEDFTRIEN